jgi:hypothetical protein
LKGIATCIMSSRHHRGRATGTTLADQKPTSVNSEYDKVELRIEPEYAMEPAELWFELVLCNAGWANFYIGVDSGSRPVTPALRITISDVYDPFKELVSLAERAFTNELPFAFEIDSEGPESRVSLRNGAAEELALFEIHDIDSPIILFAAEVNRKQFAFALAHAMQVAIRNPEFEEIWKQWANHWSPFGVEHTPVNADYFGSEWLRDLVIDPHPHKEMYYEGIDTDNYTRYHNGK